MRAVVSSAHCPGHRSVRRWLSRWSLPTNYASSAVVMLDPRKNNITDLSAVLAPLVTDPASVQNQIQIITSRDLAATVVDRLKLDDDPEFNPALARPNMVRAGGRDGCRCSIRRTGWKATCRPPAVWNAIA